jgi:hypothetical protein
MIKQYKIKFAAIFFITASFFCSSMKAQVSGVIGSEDQEVRKNSVYLEILGNGAVWSLNYDRIIYSKDKTSLFLRAGGNEYHGSSTDELSFNIIAAAGILSGGVKNNFEASMGFTYFSGSPDRLIVLATGYRFQGSKGLCVRLTPMYIYNTEKGDTFGNSLWFGFSIGYSF